MYYDHWNDLNQRAKRRGERDAEWGYMTCHNYNRHSECGAAYEDGYDSQKREIERQEEDRRYEEEMRLQANMQRDFERQRALDEEEYYYDQMEQEHTEQEYDEWGHQEYIKHMIRQEIPVGKSL